MKKNVHKFKSKILIAIAVAFTVLLLSSYITVHYLHHERIEQHTNDHLKEVGSLFEMELEYDAKLMSGLIDLIKRDEVLQGYWQDRDRESMIEYTAPVFENIKSNYRVTHLYFHDLDGFCYLRVHRPLKHGDKIKRFTMSKALKDEKLSYGIEIGAMGTFTLRVVSPWYIEGTLAGYIELGEEIEHITPEIQKVLDVELCFIFDKECLNRKKWEDGMVMLGRTPDWNQFSDVVVSSSTIDQMPVELNEYLEKVFTTDHGNHSSSVIEISIEDQNYHGRFLPLIDAAGKDVGDMIVLVDFTDEAAELHFLQMALAISCIVISIVLYVFFHYFIGRIEKRLENSLNATEALLDTMPVGVMIVGRDKKIKHINEFALSMIGARSAADVVAKPCYSVVCPAGKNQCPVLDMHQTTDNSERILLAADKSEIPVLKTVIPISYNGEDVLLETFVDITERKEGEQQLWQANEELMLMQKQITENNNNLEETVEHRTEDISRLLEQKDGFIRQLGHDLKTPLVPLVASLPIVLDSTDDVQNSERISRCIDSVTYIQKLVDKMLNFMHSTSQDKFICENIDLTKIAEEVSQSWQTVLKDKPFELINNISDSLEIFADPTAVREVVENVVSNSVKYSGDSGKIVLDAFNLDGNVVLMVTDDGIGIDLEHQDRVFDEFYKVDPSRHDRTTVGLGLSICKKTMEAMGGVISVSSEGAGEGTMVTLEFQCGKKTKCRC